jgi:hypothetical protein
MRVQVLKRTNGREVGKLAFTRRATLPGSVCHNRTVRMSHQASATSAATHAAVNRAPSARTTNGRPALAERVSGTAASGVTRSILSVDGIWTLPCGGRVKS